MKVLLVALFCCVALYGSEDGFNFDRPNPGAARMDGTALANIRPRLEEFVAHGKTAGIVTLVARNGRIASFEAIGYADLEKQTPMRKDSLFRIASLTKPVTCAAIMVLADEGRLSVVDPVEKYLPEYRGLKLNPCASKVGYACQAVSPSRPIDIEDLMTHTSGLPSSVESGKGAPPKTLAELVARGAGAQLLFEPGTSWNYSNIGIDILGRIIEVVSNKPFDQFLRDRIFGPLGMHDTSFSVPSEKQSRLASLYSLEEGKLKLVQAEWGAAPAGGVPSPAGGLISTAEDLFRFNEMMRNGGALGSTRVLSEAAVQLMTMSHTGDLKAGWVPGVGHGYGYEVVREVAGMFRYSSLGTYAKGGAYRTYEWVDPGKGLVGIILMQRTNGGDVTDEINSVIQISGAAVNGDMK